MVRYIVMVQRTFVGNISGRATGRCHGKPGELSRNKFTGWKCSLDVRVTVCTPILCEHFPQETMVDGLSREDMWLVEIDWGIDK